MALSTHQILVQKHFVRIMSLVNRFEHRYLRALPLSSPMYKFWALLLRALFKGLDFAVRISRAFEVAQAEIGKLQNEVNELKHANDIALSQIKSLETAYAHVVEEHLFQVRTNRKLHNEVFEEA